LVTSTTILLVKLGILNNYQRNLVVFTAHWLNAQKPCEIVENGGVYKLDAFHGSQQQDYIMN